MSGPGVDCTGRRFVPQADFAVKPIGRINAYGCPQDFEIVRGDCRSAGEARHA